jgi:hypothetical protein
MSKYEILRSAQDDKMTFSRGLNLVLKLLRKTAPRPLPKRGLLGRLREGNYLVFLRKGLEPDYGETGADRYQEALGPFFRVGIDDYQITRRDLDRDRAAFNRGFRFPEKPDLNLVARLGLAPTFNRMDDPQGKAAPGLSLSRGPGPRERGRVRADIHHLTDEDLRRGQIICLDLCQGRHAKRRSDQDQHNCPP